MLALTTDLSRDDLVPWFFWDEDITIGELKKALRGSDAFLRDRLLGKMLREATDVEVWRFVTPQEVADNLDRLGRRLGRKEPFWRWLIESWRSEGLVK